MPSTSYSQKDYEKEKREKEAQEAAEEMGGSGTEATQWEQEHEAHDSNDSSVPATGTTPGTPANPIGIPTLEDMPRGTYENWTGQQLADWWAAQGNQGNWYDQYADVLNPTGAEDFNWNIYAGTPVAQMFKDEQGAYSMQRVYPEAYQLYQLRTENPRDWWEQQGLDYQDIGQSEAYQGMQGLLEQFTNPEYQQQMMGQAGDYAAQSLGFESSGDYQQTMQSLQQRLDSIDLSGNMTEDQRIALSNDISLVRQENMKMLEAMRANGRDSAALYKADEISAQIGNLAIQGRLKFMESNVTRAVTEASVIMQRAQMLGDQGLAYADQYMQQANQYATTALQGYAAQLTTLVNQNSQYIDLYSQHAQQIYNSVMVSMGYDEHTMNMAQEAYEAMMAPFLDEFELELERYLAKQGAK